MRSFALPPSRPCVWTRLKRCSTWLWAIVASMAIVCALCQSFNTFTACPLEGEEGFCGDDCEPGVDGFVCSGESDTYHHRQPGVAVKQEDCGGHPIYMRGMDLLPTFCRRRLTLFTKVCYPCVWYNIVVRKELCVVCTRNCFSYCRNVYQAPGYRTTRVQCITRPELSSSPTLEP